MRTIDLFSLYVLFSQYRSCDNTLENSFFQISSYSRAYEPIIQFSLGPLLEKPNIQTKEVYCLDRPFAASHSRDTKPPCWRAKVALGHDKQRKLQFKIMYVFCLTCPCATFAHQHGGFVSREWLAAKGLFTMEQYKTPANIVYKVPLTTPSKSASLLLLARNKVTFKSFVISTPRSNRNVSTRRKDFVDHSLFIHRD